MGELGDELAQLYRRLVSQRFPRTRTPAGESGGVIDPVLPEVVDASAPSTLYLRDLNRLVNLVRTVPHPGGLRPALRADRFTVQTVTPLPPPTAFAVLEETPR
jgi:hypothetical protein